MRTALRHAVPALALLLFAAPVHAQLQYITGRVVEAGPLARPVAGAVIRLLDASGGELPEIATTNSAGAFTLKVQPGRYMLQMRRIGFEAVKTKDFAVDEGSNIQMMFTATPLAMRLEKQTVNAIPKLERGRDGMAARKALGKGVFLDRETIEKGNMGYLPSLFDSIPGIQVTANGSINSLQGWRCLYFMVNRLPVKYFPVGRPVGELTIDLEDLIPTAHEVMGIEIYRDIKEVPAEFRQQAWPTPPMTNVTARATLKDQMKLFDQSQPCGVINFWTASAW